MANVYVDIEGFSDIKLTDRGAHMHRRALRLLRR
jgi:hypothetical protein